MIVANAGTCPDCGGVLARADVGAPWCPTCQRGLDAYDPQVLPARGWTWLERWSHARAYRWSIELFDRLVMTRPARPSWTRSRIALVILSTLLLAVGLGCIAAGVALTAGDGIIGFYLAIPLFLLALVVRPRLGRAPKRKARVRREESPDLYRLIDGVAARLDTAPPDFVTLAPDFNASVRSFGLRGRTELQLGVYLWACLPAQGRVALLAHELGHLVNGDPDRGLLVQPALRTFGRLATLTGAHRTWGTVARQASGIVQFALEAVLYVISRVFLAVNLGLNVLGWREHHQAEYLADGFCADIAGREGAERLATSLVLAGDLLVILRKVAETDPPSQWPVRVEEFIAQRRADLLLYEQASLRTIGVWDSHPPAGLRLRLIRSSPSGTASYELTEQHNARIDANLAGWYRTVHGRVLGTREYRGPVDRSCVQYRKP